jgi:hypothetical protein
MRIIRASASASGTRNVYDNSLDFSSFGGSPSASGADNIAAVSSFNSAYALLSGRTRLYIPPGTYTGNSSFQFANTAGIAGSSLVIEAYGVTFTAPAGAQNGFAISAGIVQGADSAKETRIVTVNSGSDTVELVTAGQTSRFSVGQWCCVSGINMQGAGDPPNLGIFEFKKIQSIGTGTLTFTEPLVNSYKDTWPVYTAGRGGPATVFPMQGFWDQEVEFKGATFTDTGQLCYGKTRVAKWTDCTFSTYGPCPTVNNLFQAVRCTANGSGGLEVDKCVHRIEFIDCNIRAIDFQSASVNELYVYNLSQTVSSPRFRGGARNSNTFVNLTTGTFNFGPMNYGCMGPTTMTDCSASTGTFFNQTSPFSDYTEEGGGVLSYAGGPGSANSAGGSGAHWWATPGANAVLLDSSNNFARSFQISDVSQSGGRTYVHTNLPDPVPSTINGRSAPWKIIAHPCPSVTMTNCTGNTLFTTHSGLPAGTPFNEWTL